MTIIRDGLVFLVLISLISVIFNYFVLDSTWLQQSTAVVFTALFALKTIPVIDTLIDILLIVAVFEITYWTVKKVLDLLEWTKITGASFLE